jgi:hypothetical protein
MGFEVEATVPVTMADLVQAARADYADNSVEPGTAPDTDAGPDTSTGIGVDTDMETGTGIDSEPDTADGRADERAAMAYQVLLAELFEAKHCEMCDENDCMYTHWPTFLATLRKPQCRGCCCTGHCTGHWTTMASVRPE